MKFTKTALKEMKNGMSRLEKRIVNKLLAEKKDYNAQELAEYIKDVADYGCSSVCISDLVAVRLFDRYKEEVLEIVEEHFDANEMFFYNNQGEKCVTIKDSVYSYGQKRFSSELKNRLFRIAYRQVFVTIVLHFEI